VTDAGPRSARCTTSTGSASYTSAVIVPTGCGRRCPRRAGRSGSSRRMRPHRSPPRPAKPHGGSGREGHGLKAPAFRPGAPWPRRHRRPDPYLGRALRGQDGGVPDVSPVPARTRIPNTGSQRDFQSAQWTVVPTGAGTMCRHAGKIGERRLPDSPFCPPTASRKEKPGTKMRVPREQPRAAHRAQAVSAGPYELGSTNQTTR
jgi:hypothetical protein